MLNELQFGSVQREMYHGTNVSNAPGIAEHGIRSLSDLPEEHPAKEYARALGGGDSTHVWVTPSKGRATQAGGGGNDTAVVKAHVSSDNLSIREGDKSVHYWKHEGSVPPGNIESITRLQTKKREDGVRGYLYKQQAYSRKDGWVDTSGWGAYHKSYDS